MIKILGIGSPFGDDQMGFKVVEILKERNRLQKYIPTSLSIEYYDRPGVRLLELMQDAETVILIDAMVSGNNIGTQYRYENEQLEELHSVLSTHGIGVSQALALGEALNQLPTHLVFFGVEIELVTSGQEISQPVKSAIYSLVERIENEITSLIDLNKL